MAYHDRRVNPELVTAYTVSEARSPAPDPWRKQRLERSEEGLTVEEIFIAPPLPRRPDYEYPNHQYSNRGSRARTPSMTPVGYRGDYYERPAPGHHINVELGQARPRERNWHQWRARSPEISESSSGCSVSDCEECAYAESARQFDSQSRSRRKQPVPYVIVPGNSIGPRTTPSPHLDSVSVHSNEYAHRPPQQSYRLHDLSRHYRMSGGHSPPRASSMADDTPLVSNSHNQVVLFQGTAYSGRSGGRVESDGMSMLHSSVSSPRWSETGQRYLSGSDAHSDVPSHSPPTSLHGLYEQPDPRFMHFRPPPSSHAQRPVVINRSNDGYNSRNFAEEPYDANDYSDDYSEGSDRRYSESDSEGSFSSQDSGEPHGQDYVRRYW